MKRFLKQIFLSGISKVQISKVQNWPDWLKVNLTYVPALAYIYYNHRSHQGVTFIIIYFLFIYILLYFYSIIYVTGAYNLYGIRSVSLTSSIKCGLIRPLTQFLRLSELWLIFGFRLIGNVIFDFRRKIFFLIDGILFSCVRYHREPREII